MTPPDTERDINPSPQQKPINLPRIFLLGCLAVVITCFLMMIPMMVIGADKDAIIKIPKGATEQNVADSLTKYLGKGYSKKVIKLMHIRHTDYASRNGAYLIPKGMSPFMAMRKLRRGAQHPVRATINNSRSIRQIAEKLAYKTEWEAEDLEKLLSDSTVLAPYGLKPGQELALFLDDTYEIYWTSTPADVVKKIGENYTNFWNDTRRRKAAEINLTPQEAMILASIVDEETLQNDEKGRIARVYMNRLSEGMKLQADPTVRFALNDFTIRRIKGDHLSADSPYNTYKYPGLPPGPIRTTSRATLNAILDSEPTDELYFCAKEDFSGYHNFSHTYEQHIANALRYQHALDVRGIR